MSVIVVIHAAVCFPLFGICCFRTLVETDVFIKNQRKKARDNEPNAK